MNPADSQPPSDPRDPERMLTRRLRATTAQFEARFDDLRRRLAHEGPPPSRLAEFLAGIRRPRTLAAAGVAVAVAFVILARWPLNAPAEFPAADPEAWYADALALDESLRRVLVLTDAETREAVTWISTESNGGGS